MKRITLALSAPYVGLRPFTEKDALLFFGRENHVRDLLAKLGNKQRFIAVIGASGSGKSSLVRAGLIPALHRGALASAGYNWNQCLFKPGDAPIQNLSAALAKDPRWLDGDDPGDAVSAFGAALAFSPLALATLYRQKSETFHGQALLLVVDQFEEIFRYRQRNVNEAEAFIRLLLRSASEDVPIYVVITMRSDFIGNCVAFTGLPEAINTGMYLTPKLGPDRLKSVIASPLALAGGEIDPVLVNKLVNTLAGDDDLPILEHALLRMWNRARAQGRSRIEACDFEAVCAPPDVPAAPPGNEAPACPQLCFGIDNHASEVYNSLSPRRRIIARQLFLALVEFREGRAVRRPQELRQLVELAGPNERPDVVAVIDAFRAEDAGFLLPPASESLRDETLIDISHESLFRQWRLLQQWLKEEAVDAAELREWSQRAIRRFEGGGWLDESDFERARRWQARVNDRVINPAVWATRYGGPETDAQVHDYIQASLDRLNAARVDRERLEREAQEQRIGRIQAEAQLQREAAQRAEAQRAEAEAKRAHAEAEQARAENDKRQAEALAQAIHRRSIMAVAGGIALLLGIVAVVFWYAADQQRKRAEASELLATAEDLSPDESILIALAARRLSAIPKADAFVRYAAGNYTYDRVLRGHKDEVNGAQFSPDGKTVVTTSFDATARLWDAATGNELHVLRGHEDAVNSAVFSPDGKTVATSGMDKTARLWDAATGTELHVLRGHEKAVSSAKFSPDGRTVMTASWDSTARLWDAATGKELHVLRGHTMVVYSADFSPDGRTLVTTSWDETARLWDTATGEELHVLRGHEDAVNSAAFSSDGQILVTCGFDMTARLWNAATGKALRVLRGHEAAVVRAEFSPDGRTVVTSSFDKTARLWNAATGNELHVLREHEDAVNRASFSPDGRTVVTASWDSTARLWDAATGKELHVLRGHEDAVNSAAFSAHGKTIVTSSRDRTARLWKTAAGRELHVLDGHVGAVSSARSSADGKTIATSSFDKTARLWDAATGKELHVLRGHEDAVNSAAFSIDGTNVVTSSLDKTARLWDAATGKELHVLRGHEDAVGSAAFSPDGVTVVTSSPDRTARLWDAATGKELRVLRGHDDAVSAAAFSPDGKTVLTSSLDKTARLWDAATGKELHVLRGHEDAVTAAGFSADGGTALTVSADMTARLWDAATGKELHVLRGHDDAVSSAAFSPDGRTVVTSSADKTARLWDAASGRELHVLRGHEDAVSAAAFSPDGRTVVTASLDTTARLWDSTGKELQVMRGHQNTVASAEFSGGVKTVVTAGLDKSARLWSCDVCRPPEEIAAELAGKVGRDLSEAERRRFGLPDAPSARD